MRVVLRRQTDRSRPDARSGIGVPGSLAAGNGRPGVHEFVEWDVDNWSLALDLWSSRSERLRPGSSVLEIGSRHGGLSLWLALHGAQVVCSDLRGPTARARAAHRAAGVHDRVRYAGIDARRIPFRERFDVVVFKSVLGALDRPSQAAALRSMHAALKPGGELFFAENLVGSPLHRYCRRHFVPWGGSWQYVSVAEMREYLEPFAYTEYRTFGFAGAFGRSAAFGGVLSVMDRIGIARVVPEGWRYIIAGIARK